MAIVLTPKLMRMKGTDEVAPRCIALTGEIGQQVGCSIYADRPSPCHEFNPWAALQKLCLLMPKQVHVLRWMLLTVYYRSLYLVQN